MRNQTLRTGRRGALLGFCLAGALFGLTLLVRIDSVLLLLPLFVVPVVGALFGFVAARTAGTSMSAATLGASNAPSASSNATTASAERCHGSENSALFVRSKTAAGNRPCIASRCKPR